MDKSESQEQHDEIGDAVDETENAVDETENTLDLAPKSEPAVSPTPPADSESDEPEVSEDPADEVQDLDELDDPELEDADAVQDLDELDDPELDDPELEDADEHEDSIAAKAATTGDVDTDTGPRPLRTVAAGLLVFYVFLAAAWGIDAFMHRDTPARGVKVDDISVFGADSDQLADALNVVNQRLSDTEIEVIANTNSLTTTPATLGAMLDNDAMTDAAMNARRGGFLPLRPIRWLAGLFSSTSIAPLYTVDVDVAQSSITDTLSPILEPMAEPSVALDLVTGELVATQGSTGNTVAPEELQVRLPESLRGDAPYQMSLATVPAVPMLDDETMAELAESINLDTEQALAVRVLDQSATVSPAEMRAWVDVDTEDPDDVTWSINEELALSDLKPLFPSLGTEDQQAKFVVVDEEPIIIPASESVVCCDEGAGVAIKEAIDSPIPTPDPDQAPESSPGDESNETLRIAVLNPIITGADEGAAELASLGIIEQVSTFTTNHRCCENRVRNIQQFADLTQGSVIRPGETFSLNDAVGRRTREKGFFAAGAIALGNFEDQVGGGISQYATTFFNASFFAGIEFIEYQSHSIYISRYPRGREATISFPRPDLEVRNNTPYGILVWNEYTPTSITVSFYSTKHLEVEALDRLLAWDRQCRRDITPRRITFPDQTVQEDRVFASYRPGQGLDCNGNSTTPEEDEPEPAAVVTTTPATAPPATVPTTAIPTTAVPTTPVPTTPAPAPTPAPTVVGEVLPGP